MQIDDSAASAGKKVEDCSFGGFVTGKYEESISSFGCSKSGEQRSLFAPSNNTSATPFANTNTKAASSSFSFSPPFLSAGDPDSGFSFGQSQKLLTPTVHPLLKSPQPFSNSFYSTSTCSPTAFAHPFSNPPNPFDYSATPLHCFANIPPPKTLNRGTQIHPHHNQFLALQIGASGFPVFFGGNGLLPSFTVVPILHTNPFPFPYVQPNVSSPITFLPFLSLCRL